jgi:hypothetical protein
MLLLVGDAESIEAIRETLSRLVTVGLVPFNVGDNGERLLELGIVQAARAKLDPADDEASRYQADAEALRSVLEAAVEHEDVSGIHRRLLRAVLPLKPELLGKSATERRAEAGREIKLGRGDVTSGTIRNHYEPRALDVLARVLWAMEQGFQVEDIQGALAKVGVQGIFDDYNIGEQEVAVEDIQDALAKVVTQGIFDDYNIGDNGGCLLHLALVRDRLADLDGGTKEYERYQALGKAVRSVLAELIEDESIGGRSRRVLYDVLPLNEALREMSIADRRVEASKHISPAREVTPGTIRTYYEPRARQKFARAIWRAERHFRAARRDGGSAGSDEQGS